MCLLAPGLFSRRYSGRRVDASDADKLEGKRSGELRGAMAEVEGKLLAAEEQVQCSIYMAHPRRQYRFQTRATPPPNV